jgi:3-oxoacyl-[acyl-carrier-protein] synthase-3
MSLARVNNFKVAGVATCVPAQVVDNHDFGAKFKPEEVRKVVAMAGIRHRRVVADGTTSADLCFEAAEQLLQRLGWERESITGLIMTTQSPDYFFPPTSCVLHKWLGLSTNCAAFDLGLGCSGYPYGLYLAGAMLAAGGQQRILLLHGETASKFTSPDDHATTLLFGDAGSATALECDACAGPAHFALHTDGQGFEGLILRGGGFRDPHPVDERDNFVRMDGAGIFNFTIKRVPSLIQEVLDYAQVAVGSVDWYVLHQSNRFIMKHLATKSGIPEERLPIVLDSFGNTGGVSVPLALTQAVPAERTAPVSVMLVGYGVGLSWSAALLRLEQSAPLLHAVYRGDVARA